ncbi:hypothetical protein EB796_001111 [Bugula neritina]|uniref:Uncharacterized protein n=1 Tax=Bugula neritina TaxID=10212 RepID=A0A7J7KQW8_BUGNE|nr:hypothetical protein EB796_001111 [Bugula neritina]
MMQHYMLIKARYNYSYFLNKNSQIVKVLYIRYYILTTLPFSMACVTIMIALGCSCHIMNQKSLTVA